MSHESSTLNSECSSCMIIGYKRDLYVLKLAEDLKELMKNDLEKILKQQGVVHQHVTLPVDNMRLNAGQEKKRKPGIMRQIVTKDDKINKKGKSLKTENSAASRTSEKIVQTENLTSSTTLALKNQVLMLENTLAAMKSKEKPLNVEDTDSQVDITITNEYTSQDDFEGCKYCCNTLLPKSGRHVATALQHLIGKCAVAHILLAVVYEFENYHINVINICTGICLGCVLATESGFLHTDTQIKLAESLTFYIYACDKQGSHKEKSKHIDTYFQYMREANKKKRLRDEYRSKRAHLH